MTLALESRVALRSFAGTIEIAFEHDLARPASLCQRGLLVGRCAYLPGELGPTLALHCQQFAQRGCHFTAAVKLSHGSAAATPVAGSSDR